MAINRLTATIAVNAPIALVWELWTNSADIQQWNNFSDDWHVPHAENNLYPGGRFLFEMGLKDGSLKFDFAGTYTEVKPFELIAYKLDDDRQSVISFNLKGDVVEITETFEPNNTDPVDMQQDFCQTVLKSFKTYAEKSAGK